MTERQLQDAVLALAKMLGWRTYHTHDSRRSTAGFPDLTLVRGERLIFAELKSERGDVKKEQTAWLEDLSRVAAAAVHDGPAHQPLLMVTLWRPEHLDDEIPRALARGGR